MKIILANPRGFCAGVNMAIESLETALELFGSPLYVYHEIVHNRPIVERFRTRGVVFVDDISEVPDGGDGALQRPRRRAGHPRSTPTERNLRAIDATCPLVTKVHMEAVRFAREGYTIVLIGHEGHDEVIGTMGEAPANMVLVEDADGRGRAHLAGRREARLPDADDAERGRGEGRHRRARSEVPADRRAEQGRHLLRDPEPPGGGARRSCPRPTWCWCSAARTARTASGWPNSPAPAGKPAYLIDRVDELQDEWFQPTDTVLVTAGASAPEDTSRSASST